MTERELARKLDEVGEVDPAFAKALQRLRLMSLGLLVGLLALIGLIVYGVTTNDSQDARLNDVERCQLGNRQACRNVLGRHRDEHSKRVEVIIRGGSNPSGHVGGPSRPPSPKPTRKTPAPPAAETPGAPTITNPGGNTPNGNAKGVVKQIQERVNGVVQNVCGQAEGLGLHC